jgi:hypothetical protein
MKKKKAAKKTNSNKKKLKPVVSSHAVRLHTDKIRETVHDALASAGIYDLALRSMQFGPPCPDGEHSEQICTDNGDGTQTCTWTCVPN